MRRLTLLTKHIKSELLACDALGLLETGDSMQKIRLLSGGLGATDDPKTIQKVIERLDDDDLQVRGEAFSWLILNENRCIYDHLVSNLRSSSKNIRGFASLILANRREMEAVSELVALARDQSAMVRSCAIGALGYLNALDADAQDVMVASLFDDNSDVKKSAAHSLITTGCRISDGVLHKLSDDWKADMSLDSDLKILFERLARLATA